MLKRPKHSTVVAYAALFVALGGTATAAGVLPLNSVTSRHIKNGTITQSDLNKKARGVPKARIAQVVEDTMTSTEVLSALSVAVEGDRGPQGPVGVGERGPQGDPGPQGQQGPRGQALAFGHVDSNGTSSTQDMTVTMADGHYCISATGPATAANAVVTLDAADIEKSMSARPFVQKPGAGDPCAGAEFAVIVAEVDVANVTAIDHGFYVALN